MASSRVACIRGTTYPHSFAFMPDTAPMVGPDEVRSPGVLPPLSVSPFRSAHVGGCTFLLADGSVHVLAEEIDAKLYVGLSSLGGKEPVEIPPETR